MEITKGAVVVNKFVRRQTKQSPYSHYQGGTLEQLAIFVQSWLCETWRVRPGYRDGVVLVGVPESFLPQFRCSTVELNTESEFITKFEPRVPGEDPRLHVLVKGSQKSLPKAVDIVLYRRDVLDAEDRSEGTAEWEIISINARVTAEPEPMHPLTMARNFLGKKGGTDGNYTAQQFAEAIWFWSAHALTAGPDDKNRQDDDVEQAHAELDELGVRRLNNGGRTYTLYGRVSELREDITCSETRGKLDKYREKLKARGMRP